MFNNITTELGNKESLEKQLFSDGDNVSKDLSFNNIPQIPESAQTFGLPSDGVFYTDDIKTVQLLPLTIGQVVDVEKIYSNNKTASEQFEFFVNIVHRSVYGINVLDLTLPDFYAVCYELRRISYKKEPFMIQAEFEIGGEVRTLSTPVIMDSITVKKLDSKNNIKTEFDYMRVKDWLYIFQNLDSLSSLEYQMFPFVKGATAQDKLANFRAARADQLQFIQIHQYNSYHGLNKMVKIKSPDGEIIEQEMAFEYRMFFPSVIYEGFYNGAISSS